MTILMIALITLTAILWIWALVDILRSNFENSLTQLLWIILIFIFPILGSIVYFQFRNKFTEKPKRIKY